jgi:hypothetical protein
MTRGVSRQKVEGLIPAPHWIVDDAKTAAAYTRRNWIRNRQREVDCSRRICGTASLREGGSSGTYGIWLIAHHKTAGTGRRGAAAVAEK